MQNWNSGYPPIRKNPRTGTMLVSEWVTVLTDEKEIKAYYHVWHGWMCEGEIDETWRFGYRPLLLEVKGWR